ncbi:M48 family metallopeptidase [Methylobacterium gnaphalii]|uniref:Protease HtpX n=1 Tax=Methylobacterium gnaphalii TaxID=1010610 RepID=A0A512JL71_9HYPH|nr:M48 family metallopeptidase [Methylobacterium gnaphalii]GEP10709.1 protease HtpX [Methylobacterium gnaphalii]GJD67420.1 Protease HtpX [Methylobacterium gnaphalii]GLS47301.1 protease HtpX [Methylobacterium gnaphalii]
MLPAFGLYTHIRQNEVRSRALVAGLFALNLVLAYGIALVLRGMSANLPAGARPGFSAYLHAAFHDLLWIGPLSIAVTFAWLFIAYHAHRAMISATVGAHPVTREEAPDLYRLLEPLCISRGMAMPTLLIVDDPALNAYATGLNPEQYAITVTTGLRDALTPREMQAVLGHELTHIRNDDVRTMMIAIVIAGIFAFVAEAGYRTDLLRNLFSGNRDGKNRAGAVPAMLLGALLIALAWILSKAIRFALSRSREFVADAGAVELTKDPDALISALIKISGRGDLARAPSGVMELCFDNPRVGFTDFFATHPPIEARIDALMRYAGGRLPPPG